MGPRTPHEGCSWGLRPPTWRYHENSTTTINGWKLIGLRDRISVALQDRYHDPASLCVCSPPNISDVGCKFRTDTAALMPWFSSGHFDLVPSFLLLSTLVFSTGMNLFKIILLLPQIKRILTVKIFKCIL